ncbi:MAG: hydratase [Erysipelotrichaceae bacterium]|nr:hydratase [Erysipelotrichaceae bacterium]
MKLFDTPVVIRDGKPCFCEISDKESGYRKTMAFKIMDSHDNHKSDEIMHITFDSLTSHDITYVSIIQTARASGIEEFRMPYVLTNCHNSLCAVGGTINEDDHRFALSAAHKYGGIYVPANYAVIHSYNREMMTGCGRMILGSDSHTRYGALGTMGIGEGGGELAKQLVGKTYDVKYPEVVLVYLHGEVKNGVGPHDVALELVRNVYESGFVKNRVLEFAGPGINNLSQDFRNGIDVMTTETTCFSSIWETDEKTEEYYRIHKRENDYKKLNIEEGAYYDRYIDIDLSEIECMIALPMHPSYAVSINELKKDSYRYLKEAQDRANSQLKGSEKMDLLSKIDKGGNIHVDQAIIAGCSGGIYENICAAAQILKGRNIGNGSFRLSVYPDSLPVSLELIKKGVVNDLLESGAVYREAFCGPCFGAGDVPANNELSIRHTTRNFPNREGSKPNEGQLAMVALMDARSIAATAANGGILTAASDLDIELKTDTASFNSTIYENRVYNGYGKAEKDYELRFGPNIKDWPSIRRLSDDVLIKVVTHIDDPVTTTDELIPSGETSSYRSNPLRLAEYTLSRRDPDYVRKAREVYKLNENEPEFINALKNKKMISDNYTIGSAVYANKPGDGSAREQAASCQRVLGAVANFAKEYATKRYRSNCINWGILPFVVKDSEDYKEGNWILIRNIRDAIINDSKVEAYLLEEDDFKPLDMELGYLSLEEKAILLSGCLINYYKDEKGDR